MKYAHVLNDFMSTPWAIMPEKMLAMIEFLNAKALDIQITDEQIKQRIGAQHEGTQHSAPGSVAVIPVYGVLSQKMNMLSAISGGTSTEILSQQIKSAVNDDSIAAIVLDIDSPGGSVYGISELANEIYKARGTKPIIAQANSLSASAAYWIASATDEIFVTPGGEVGSIGVLTAHHDVSVKAENEGVKVTLISAGKYKTEGNSFEPLSDDAMSAIQSRVDDYYKMFTEGVAKGRGANASDIVNGYGEGRTVGAKQALKENLADKISTLSETIDKVRPKARRSTRVAANRLRLETI